MLVALVIRELRARVGGQWIGLLWMLFEPLANVVVMMTLTGFRHHITSVNTDYPVYLITGMLPYFMFRNLARRLPSAITANRGLYAYRQVKPIDTMVARGVVEIGLSSAVYLSALLILGWIGFRSWWPVAPLELLAVSAVLLLLGASLGLLFAVLAHGRPRVSTMINLLFMPLYLLSGVLFPINSLPPVAHGWLLMNPVMHLIDLSRMYFLPHFQLVDGVTWGYPISCTLVIMALALALFRINRHKLIAVD